MRTFLLLLTVALLGGCAYKHLDADLVVHNAIIHSLDEGDSTFQAMAVRDGRIQIVDHRHRHVHRQELPAQPVLGLRMKPHPGTELRLSSGPLHEDHEELRNATRQVGAVIGYAFGFGEFSGS